MSTAKKTNHITIPSIKKFNFLVPRGESDRTALSTERSLSKNKNNKNLKKNMTLSKVLYLKLAKLYLSPNIISKNLMSNFKNYNCSKWLNNKTLFKKDTFTIKSKEKPKKSTTFKVILEIK
jgi:hypothetical protein